MTLPFSHARLPRWSDPLNGKQQSAGEAHAIESREPGRHGGRRVVVDIRPEGAIPDREDGAEVRVALRADPRVMPAMERRGDEGSPERALDAGGEIDVAVLDEIRHREHDFEGEDGHRCRPEEHDGGESEWKGEQQLAWMEADAGRGGEGRVRVVDPVEAPQDGQAMGRA